MTDITLGKFQDENTQRDAIHVAIVPCVCGDVVYAGQAVDVINGNISPVQVKPCVASRGIGIVDPFLPHISNTIAIPVGKVFNVLVYQNTVTGMRHAWEHPDIKDKSVEKVIEVEKIIYKNPSLENISKEESYNWIENFIANSDINHAFSVEEVINAALGNYTTNKDDYLGLNVEGDYFYCFGTEASGVIPSEFWDHVENYSGEKCPYRATYFTCSC